MVAELRRLPKLVPGLEPHRWALASAWVKSMRLSLPAEALYYYHLLGRTPKYNESTRRLRLLHSTAEDSMSVWVLTDGLTLWKDRQELWAEDPQLFRRRTVAHICNIASHPNSYNSGAYGLQYDWTYTPDEGYQCTLKKALRLLVQPPRYRSVRRQWVHTHRLWLTVAEYVDDAAFYGVFADWLTHKYYQHPHKFLLEPLAQAFHRVVDDLAKLDKLGGYNWQTRLAFIACAGAVTGKHREVDDLWYRKQNRLALKAVKLDLGKGRVRIPLYAYDNRHVWPREDGLADARFAGTSRGVAHMFAMARKYGRLDRRKQSLDRELRVPSKYLHRPFLKIRVR